jgi:ABC-2 type transport system permease protein
MRAFAAQTRIEMLLTLRRGESLLVAIVVPAALLAFFTLVPALPVSGDPVDALLPGVLSVSVMATSMVSLGIATGFERQYAVLKRLGATPLGRLSLIAAKGMSALMLEVVTAVLLLTIAVLLGWTGRPDLAWFAVSLGLGTAAFAGIGMLLAGTLRAEANLAAVNGIFIALLLLGGALVPLASLPDALRGVAAVLPAAALTEVFGTAVGQNVDAGSFLTLLVWAAMMPPAASLAFSWEPR